MFKIFMFVCAIFFLSFAPLNAEPKKIVAATDATWPPMEFEDENKVLTGFSIEYMKSVAKEAGLEVSFKNVPWESIFALLKADKIDIVCASVSITEERKKNFDFSQPYFNVTQSLVVKKDDTASSMQDVQDKTLGAQFSTTGLKAIQKAKIKIKAYENMPDAFDALKEGKIDGIVCDSPVATYYSHKAEKYKDLFKVVSELKDIEEEHYAFVVNKGNTELLEVINKGISTVKAKGIDKELENKWLGD